MQPLVLITTHFHYPKTQNKAYTPFLFHSIFVVPVSLQTMTTNAITVFSNDRWPFCRYARSAGVRRGPLPISLVCMSQRFSLLHYQRVHWGTSTLRVRTSGGHAGTRPLIRALWHATANSTALHFLVSYGTRCRHNYFHFTTLTICIPFSFWLLWQCPSWSLIFLAVFVHNHRIVAHMNIYIHSQSNTFFWHSLYRTSSFLFYFLTRSQMKYNFV